MIIDNLDNRLLTYRIVVSNIVSFEERNSDVVSPRGRITRAAQKHCVKNTWKIHIIKLGSAAIHVWLVHCSEK